MNIYKNDLFLVNINELYTDYLRDYDSRVPFNNSDSKNRAFVGVLINCTGISYFAPLSSPKKKHKNINEKAFDIFKIKDGDLGIINLNNMIPVVESEYAIINVNVLYKDKDKQKYIELIKDQLDWINANKKQIIKKANRLLSSYKNNKISSSLKERCCNYCLLEIKCKEYGEF